jgi:hypothetical protein
MIVYETLRAPPRVTDWLTHVVDIQPRYNDPPNNYVNQIQAREQLGLDALHELARAIAPLVHDPTAVSSLISYFAGLVNSAAEYIIAYSNMDGDHNKRELCDRAYNSAVQSNPRYTLDAFEDP